MMDSAPSQRRVARGSVVRRGVLFALLWWVISEGRADSWLLGLIAVAAAVWSSLHLVPARPATLRLAALPRFIGFFVMASVSGGIQVARIALHPGRSVLKPALMQLSLSLPAGPPRMLMTSALSLMPGTVGVSLRGDTLLIHVLDERLAAASSARALEQHIARLFGASS